MNDFFVSRARCSEMGEVSAEGVAQALENLYGNVAELAQQL
jgi:hypothetical protein